MLAPIWRRLTPTCDVVILLGCAKPKHGHRGESDKLFTALFPNGFAGEDVPTEIALEGWSRQNSACLISDKADGARSLRVEMMNTEVKKIHRDAIEDAKHEPIPTIVLAYENVSGHFPHGWPPWEFQDRSK
jgi:hypothetical protein